MCIYTTVSVYPPSTLQLELFLSSGTVCLSIYSLVAAIFGMNIPYTWKEGHGYIFKWVGTHCLQNSKKMFKSCNQLLLPFVWVCVEREKKRKKICSFFLIVFQFNFITLGGDPYGNGMCILVSIHSILCQTQRPCWVLKCTT